ncbi:glycerate kinase [Corynebacterium deserti GIMN1.010]|uniref:Glycerate kinase n=1 Tax=Corynebacterium deserti GIMN1.010 TaxID=931089 RepID=A0A0M4CS67_9CORY|nr:glycerate kinase [Corynebacterium deserti]ALC07117.1 glycerate kinase [Corynebacterium deserti GIMN1.010]
MKFVLAPDSFKESLSSLDAVEALAAGIQEVYPHAHITKVPMADGGEGTCEVITNILGGEFISINVHDPLGAATTARFGFVAQSKTAIIEVAEAIGIHLIEAEARDIWAAQSFGVGELLTEALNQGAQKIILGLGGTVTNDGGAGMLSALGVQFKDKNGNTLDPTPRNLSACTSLDTSDLDPRWRTVEIILASDVTSPATGKEGATYIFGPQKGATPDSLEELDKSIATLVRALELHTGKAIDSLPGAGAAGALPIGLFALFSADMTPGADLILDLVKFDDLCTPDSFVLTGEGRIDNQTAVGKGPARVASRAKAQGSKVFAFGGLIDSSSTELTPALFDAIIPINRDVGDLKTALESAGPNLSRAAAMSCSILEAAQSEGAIS